MKKSLFAIAALTVSLWADAPKIEKGEAYDLQEWYTTPIHIGEGKDKCVVNVVL